jgi:integrase/recombinase XerD
MDALRTHRDRAIVEAMLLGGCGAARSWACGSRICAQANVVSSSQRAKTVIRRIVPISARFFTTVAAYLDIERPRISAADRVFVVLKGPRRGQPHLFHPTSRGGDGLGGHPGAGRAPPIESSRI